MVNKKRGEQTPVDMKYDEPQHILNPVNDLESGFTEMEFNKVPEGIQSNNYSSGSAGWRIDKDGNIYANSGTFSGALIAGELHIPDRDTTANSFHVATDGNAWWGATETDFNLDNSNATAYVLKTGVAKFKSVTLDTNVTLSGLQAGSAIDGQYLDALSVASASVASSAISTAKIATDAVTQAKIAALAVGSTELAAGAVIAGKITAGTIVTGDIASNTITAANIAALTITASELATDSVTAAKIVAGTITATEMTIAQLSAINADMGAITAGTITLPSGGHIKSGQTAYETGIGFYLGNDSGTVVFSMGNSTDYFKWDGTSVKILASGVNAITIDYGSDILLKEGGDIKFTSVTAPTALTSALITSAGNVDAGTHTYKVTYVNDSGGTEQGGASNTVTNDASNAQNALTNIPVSTSGSVTSRKIYRTKAGGTSYFLLTTIANNTATTYTDNTADSGLTGNGTSISENNSFGKIKIDDVSVFSIGTKNTFVGENSGISNTAGVRNAGLGNYALVSNIAGYNNTALGNNSLNQNTIGWSNTGVGYTALVRNTTGSYNTALGAWALESSVTGFNNIGLGYFAGSKATGSNELYIDNQPRASNAVEKTNSIIYGVMASTPASQTLTVNALLKVNGDETLDGTLSIKEQASANADVAGYGQLWVKIATPNELWFTDDAGNDREIGSENAQTKNVEVVLTDNSTAPTVVDGLGDMYFIVPAELDGMNLVSVGAHATTVSSSGLPSFQIHNLSNALDMLSTNITLDVSEKDSATATTPAVINTSNDHINTGDEIRFDCDVVGTGAKGITIRLGFRTP